MTLTAGVSAAGLAADAELIGQRGREFSPDALTVAPGTMVRIANDDRVTHHVFVDQPEMKFDSGEQDVGNAVTLTFDRARSIGRADSCFVARFIRRCG